MPSYQQHLKDWIDSKNYIQYNILFSPVHNLNVLHTFNFLDSFLLGKQIIVCAHRYTRREIDHRWGHGKCFTLSQTLDHQATWDPCQGRDKRRYGNQQHQRVQKLILIFTFSLSSRAHEQWGYCQAGTSAILTEDNTALIGSPGPFTWRGTVFALSIEDDFLFRDKTHYHTAVTEDSSPVDKYSYFGMSVASGDFLTQQQSCGQRLSYAGGAPRAGGGHGKVLLFVKCGSAEIMRVQKVLTGDNFASSFGYSLAAADVNSDGRKDLLVGAPFFTGEDGSGGAVYVYMNGKDGISDSNPPMKLTGKPESRFGFAIANAGDVNNDGVEDVAIGAPYDGRGKVFLHLGSVQEGLSSKPSQVISAKEIPFAPRIRTFGYSLHGGMDFDLNNHTDIVIGAYESDMAVILRSRPVIDISTWFGKHPKRINPKLRGCDADLMSSEVCFTVESCFLIKKFPSNIDHTYIRYTLAAEIFPGGRKISRIRFGDQASNATWVSEKTVEIQRNSLTGCFMETVYLKEGITDLTTPITFHLSLSLDQDEPMFLNPDSAAVPNINHFPILNMHEASKFLDIPLQKNCGDDDLCTSDLTASLTLSGLDKTTNSLHLQERQEVHLDIAVSNFGEPAYAASIKVFLDSAFTYIGRSGAEDIKGIVNCELTISPNENDPNLPSQEVIECKLGNPYNQGSNHTLSFRLVPVSTSGRSMATRKAEFNVTTYTTSEDINIGTERGGGDVIKFDIIKRAEVSIVSTIQPQEIWFGGKLLGESAMKVMSDIGSKISHNFQVSKRFSSLV